jgi:Niemann-Pick C2 protein
MQIVIVFSVLLVTISAAAEPLNWKPCGGSAEISSVTGDPCGSPVCEVHSGENITLAVTFTPTSTVYNLTAKVIADIGNLPPIPFNPPHPDACEDSGLTCPLKANQKVTYTDTLGIPKGTPSAAVKVEWMLNEESSTVVCFEVEVVLE